MLINIDSYIVNRQLEELANLTHFNQDITESLTVSPNHVTSTHQPTIDYNQLNNFKSQIQTEMEKKLSSFECISCHRLFIKDRVRLTTNNELDNPILKRLTEGDEVEKFYLCREQCYRQIFTLETIPIFSALNNMRFTKPPPQVSELNLYEATLCRKAKCFQTIVQLSQRRNNPSAIKTVALRGLAIHLPLNFEETHDFINDSTNELPNADAFNIIVNGLPTKTGNVWRNLVDMYKVYNTLYWLKQNNHLYEAIEINESYLYEPRSLLFVDNTDLTKEQIEQASYLTDAKEELFTQYTVLDLDKINENVPCTQKYQCKRVLSSPYKDRFKHMDHLCFFELFPFGVGGMYDDRTKEVPPAMYIKWLLQQAVPDARRNQQYLFSCLHNKDIRAADSGIYATLHSSNMPNLTALMIEINDRN